MKTFLIVLVLVAVTINSSAVSMIEYHRVILAREDRLLGVGVIIAPRFFLTTWTLLRNETLDKIQVVAGTHTPGAERILSIAAAKYYYDRYEVRLEPPKNIRPIHNIAVVLVNGTFNVSHNPFLKPALMVGLKYEPTEGTTAKSFVLNPQDHLATDHMTIISRQECGKAYKAYNKTYNGEICARGARPEIRHCYGDEGTPIFIGQELLGIASRIDHCQDPTLPTVFTNIGYHRDWIDRIMDIVLGSGLQEFPISWDRGIANEIGNKFFSWLRPRTCLIGPELKTIKYVDCFDGCAEYKKIGTVCKELDECLCQSTNGDISLYNIMNKIEKSDFDGAICFIVDCPHRDLNGP